MKSNTFLKNVNEMQPGQGFHEPFTNHLRQRLHTENRARIVSQGERLNVRDIGTESS